MSAPMSDAENRAHVEKLRDMHRFDPLADEIEAAQLRGHKVVGRWRGRLVHQRFEQTGDRKLSSAATENPRIRDAVDEAKLQKRTAADPDWMTRHGFDYVHSNLPDRKALPHRSEGYDLNKVYTLDSQRDRNKIVSSLEAATMGEPGACVVLIDPAVPCVTPGIPPLRQDGDVMPCAVTFSVSHGMTGARVAALVMHKFASQCRWCDVEGVMSTPSEGLVVSAGATVYVFPTCRFCRDDLESYFEPFANALDFVSNDGEQHAMGWPADWNF